MGALTVFCSLIISCLQNESSYQYIMADMFVDRKDDGDDEVGTKKGSHGRRQSFSRSKTVTRFKRKNDVQWNSLKSLVFNIQTTIPHKWLCRCLKPKGMQKHYLEKYKKLKEQVSIVTILQQLRVLNSFARQELKKSGDDWLATKNRNSLKFFDEQKSDSSSDQSASESSSSQQSVRSA